VTSNYLSDFPTSTSQHDESVTTEDTDFRTYKLQKESRFSGTKVKKPKVKVHISTGDIGDVVGAFVAGALAGALFN
jgi:hypothetical protein